MEARIYYNRNEEPLVTQKVSIDYIKRYPDAFEKISDDIKDNPLISVSKKSFYYLEEGDSKVSLVDVFCNGTNNSWVNLTTKKVK